MEIVISWIVLSIIIGFIGSDRNVGFFGALLWCLFLSPIIGLIITLLSESNQSIRMTEKSIKFQEEQKGILNRFSNNPGDTISELLKLSELKHSGILDEDEFRLLKKRLINGDKINLNSSSENELKEIEAKYKRGELSQNEYEISKSNILGVNGSKDNGDLNVWLYVGIFIVAFVFLYLML